MRDSWRAQEDITDGGDALGQGSFGAVVPGELDGVAVAVKWASGTDASREALLREYSFLRSPGLHECYFVMKASPALTFADVGPLRAFLAKHQLSFEHTAAVDITAHHRHTSYFPRTGDQGLLWDGNWDNMPLWF